MNQKFCHSCGSALIQQARFCSNCGAALDPLSSNTALNNSRPSSAISPKRLLLVALAALPLWGIAWYAQNDMAGPPPPPSGSLPGQQASSQSGSGHAAPASYNDPQLIRLREAVKAGPSEISNHQALAGEILQRLQSSESPQSELAMELVQVLAEILKLDPNDKSALVTMADVSFNQQVFDKASDYYKRYLGLAPNDHQIRARLGSTLAFLGKFEEAQKELRLVLKEDPKNFEASAYLAVTYAQMGNSVEAIKLGEEALKKAPSDEARARFTQFIDSVRNNKQAVGPEAATSSSAKPVASMQSTASTTAAAEPSPAIAAVVAHVQQNDIAGPKFSRYEVADEGATVKLYFKQFPMEAMPPFIRDRFLNKLKDAGRGGTLKEIVVLDADQGTEMARVKP
jgi:tetratricopeptide (TPR) repeat protein